MTTIDHADSAAEIADSLANNDYIRQRLEPQPGDSLYLPLVDLRLFLEPFTKQRFEAVLDYGCGGSPYRQVFDAQNYIRADYVASPGVTIRIDEAGRLPLPDGSCDAVLSTQVLEHVFSPREYLIQALRVLRPGGKLILTTHGIWEDHGCPYDFWRWTAEGLRRELDLVGFQVESVNKLTTGSRAALFMLKTNPLRSSRRNLAGILLRLFSRLARRFSKQIDQWSDRCHCDNRVVDATAADHRLYIGIGIVAIKPLTPPQNSRQ